MKLPQTTPKQQALIRLIYRYRFLERKQIQQFLGHKDKRRVSSWLKELREQQFIDWFYEPDNPDQRSQPAIYLLAVNGIRFLRQAEGYPEGELRKRYRESTRQPSFVSRCLLLADCCLNLKAKSIDDVKYSFVTQADYADEEHEYHHPAELNPQLCYTKQKGKVTTNFLLEIFDITLPHYQLRKRLKDYVDYIANGEWEAGTSYDQPPIILLACPTTSTLIYAKRRVRQLLADIYADEDIHIRFATIEQIRKFGVAGKIWEEA